MLGLWMMIINVRSNAC